jgi:hypothetical protein
VPPEPTPPTAVPTETPATTATAATGGGGGTEEAAGQQLVLKILGAIGTGVGVLGFVTFFGGAIIWLRADNSNLPANDAVSAVPNGVLVTTGASFLVPAVLLALLAVALIFVSRQISEVPRKAKQRTTFDSARRLLHEAEETARRATAKTQFAQAVRAQATSLADLAEQLAKDASVPEVRKTAAAGAAGAKRLEAERAEAEALMVTSEAAQKKAEAENLQAASQFALQRTHREFLIELWVGAAVLLVLPPVANQALFHVTFFWDGAILVGIAALATTISLVTYVTTEKFVWFGIVAFVTVGAYIGAATFFSTTDNPKIEPAAALRTGHPPVIGIYIADTSTNLYLGSFPEPGKPSRLIVLPRAQVTDLSVGPLLERHLARKRAAQIALEECDQVITTPAPAPAPTPAPTPAPAPQSGSGSGSASGSKSEAKSAAVPKPAPPPVEEPACTAKQKATLDPYLG